MANATITGTASNFGTISGVLAGEAGEVSGSITGVITGDLEGSVGVPGPVGPQGPTGATGPAGPGLPAGGLEGQIIVKNSSAIDYDTEWVDNYSQTVQATVRNQTGSTLTKGTVVYISGGAGNKPLVTKASATSESSSSKTFAILAEDILNNQNGQATTLGLLKGIDTSAFGAGANLWLSTTAGEITATMPTSPNHAVFLGNVVRVNSTDGEIEVRIQNGYELGELHDVLITTPSNGQVLKYESATGLWKNQTDLNSGVWGSITGTLSSQTDLQTALDGKVSKSGDTLGDAASLTFPNSANGDTVVINGTYPIRVSSDAAPADSTYIGSQYLLLSNTAGSQLYVLPTQINFPDSTVQTTAFIPGDYLSKSGNLAGLASTSSARTNLGLGTMATETASNYLTTSAASSTYLTQANAATTYYPLSSNPAGYLTSSSLTGYATESWVSSQGYLTSGDLTGYAELSGAAFTGAISVASGFNQTTVDATTVTLTDGTDSLTLSAFGGSSITFSDSTVQTTAFIPADYLTVADIGGGSEPAGDDILDGLQNSTAPSTSNPFATEGYADSVVSSFAAQVADNYAPLASPALTGTPTSTTAAADTNTTQIATTAYVIGQASSTTPSATGTAAVGTSLKYARADHVHANPLPTGGTTGQVLSKVDGTNYNVQWSTPSGGGDYATIEETLVATASDKALSPARIPYIVGLPGYRPMNSMTVTSVSGSGAGFDNRGWTRSPYLATASTAARATAISSLYSGGGIYQHLGSSADTMKINFSKKCAFWGLAVSGMNIGTEYFGNTNNFMRVNLGGRAGAAASGNITTKGIGFYLAAGGASNVFLTVHNGTTRTDVDSGFAPATQSVFHFFVYSDGAGNVDLYINGDLKCSTNAGPTGNTSNYQNSFEEQIEGSSSGIRYIAQFAGEAVYIEQ